ncbi:hypothetical protein [Rhizobium anhuiense]|nr:hypothetical protein [Rhizobium anhuiense]
MANLKTKLAGCCCGPLDALASDLYAIGLQRCGVAADIIAETAFSA